MSKVDWRRSFNSKVKKNDKDNFADIESSYVAIAVELAEKEKEVFQELMSGSSTKEAKENLPNNNVPESIKRMRRKITKRLIEAAESGNKTALLILRYIENKKAKRKPRSSPELKSA